MERRAESRSKPLTASSKDHTLPSELKPINGRSPKKEVVAKSSSSQIETETLSSKDGDLFVKLEMLQILLEKQVITKEEFQIKKAEILNFITANEQLFASLEKLHEFKTRGIIWDDEYESKKTDLLKKLV